MFISVHLPKTAGTSFIKSLKAQFGNGLRIDNNDLPVNTKPYERNKAALKESVRIAEHWKNIDVKCIHGHFLPLKYFSKIFFNAELVAHKVLVNNCKGDKYKISESLRKQIECFHEFNMNLYRRVLEIRQNRLKYGEKNA